MQVEQATEPVSLQQEVDGVTVTLKKTSAAGGGEEFETFKASYVVGADGARGE